MNFFGFKKLDKKAKQLDMDNIPHHIAFIMDGNGRWAKKRMLPRNMGHSEGVQALKRVLAICKELGVKCVTFYAFSTENWSRPKEEVDAIMDLLLKLLKNSDKELNGEVVKINVLGDITPLSDEIKREIERIRRETMQHKNMTMNIAINYGSRDEIVYAAKRIAQMAKNRDISVEDINKELFSKSLYTEGIPDPELLIRSSGEQRISNFLLWQCAYTEFIFTKTLWPDFDRQDIIDAILTYQKRDRRFGGI